VDWRPKSAFEMMYFFAKHAPITPLKFWACRAWHAQNKWNCTPQACNLARPGRVAQPYLQVPIQPGNRQQLLLFSALLARRQ